MNKKFCSKLAEQVNGLYFVSKFKLARILVAVNSNEELLKGVCVKNTSSGVSVLTWFCPIAHFSYPNDPLMFMVFEGGDFGGEQSGWISNKVSSEFLAPKKDENVLMKDVADYIKQRMASLEEVKTPNDFIALSKRFPSSFTGGITQLQLGLIYYSQGEIVLGENMIRESIMVAGPLRNQYVEEFLSLLDKGSDIADIHIIKIKERNRKYLEDNGFYLKDL